MAHGGTDLYEEILLLKRMRDGDHTAFERLYMAHAKLLYWKLLKLLKHPEDADELLQDLFVKVWERREQIDPNQPFNRYLYRIAQRMVVDYYRRMARVRIAHLNIGQTSTELDWATDEAILSKETSQILNTAISLLPPQRREAFILCKMDGKSYKEAAEIMQISPNTVHNHLVKAVGSIKAHLERADVSSGLQVYLVFMIITQSYQFRVPF